MYTQYNQFDNTQGTLNLSLHLLIVKCIYNLFHLFTFLLLLSIDNYVNIAILHVI